LRPLFRTYGTVCLFAFATPAFSGEVPQNLPTCPKGQSRPIVEEIVTPAIIKDIYGKVEDVILAGSGERHIPTITKWVEMPEDYVRPKTVKLTTTHRTRALYVPSYEPYEFRKQSHDIVILINGDIDRRGVPAIWTQRVTYSLDPATVIETVIKETERPYNPEEYEKNGKLRVVVSEPYVEQMQNAGVRKFDAIIRQDRTPAHIRQKWGDCEVKSQN